MEETEGRRKEELWGSEQIQTFTPPFRVFQDLLPFFKKKNIYLLIFGHAESSLLHSGFSLVATSGGYSLIVVHRLLLVVSSLVGEHRLSCPKACEIFPGWGLNLCPLLCEMDS